MLFPVGNKKVFGFGLQQVYRTNSLDITDKNFHFIGTDESLTDSPIAYKKSLFYLMVEYPLCLWNIHKNYPHIFPEG